MIYVRKKNDKFKLTVNSRDCLLIINQTKTYLFIFVILVRFFFSN